MKAVFFQPFIRWFILLFCSLFLVSINVAHAETTSDEQTILQQQIPALLGNNFSKKQQAVTQLTTLQSPAAYQLLSALLDGRLSINAQDYYIKEASKGSEQYQQILQAQTLTALPNDAKRVIINNKIRMLLRNYQAQYQLLNGNKAQRLQAIQQILSANDLAQLDNVKTALPKEKDAQIQSLMHLFLARIDLSQADTSRHSAALAVLGENALPENLNLLENYAANAPTDNLKQQAEKAINKIKNKLLIADGVQTVSYGLSLGSVLILTAIGLAITFGVMGVINMAHGELMMIGAYTTYVVQQLMPNHITASIFVALPAAFLVSAFVGILIEVLVVRHLYGRPLETLLATFGVSLILQQAVRTIFSPLNRLVQTPEFMQGEWIIMPNLSITLNRVYIFAFCLVCFVVLLLIMKRTRLGLEVGAISQNRAMARAMGINDRKVDILTFGLGAGIAGLAGVALSQLTNVGPNLGQQYIVDSFMVVVIGGVGNLWGTFFSGLGLGILNKFLEPAFGAVLAKALVLVLIILFIQKYPRGLFPQKGRAAE
ncbi:urea ABC transporter permease subunit UrtB [Gallibacterium salpingitidis]|uniref:urea ABC transporter permease subunit UrtB n=1 Tax=Gallibacterium salpingitidis TaxID=505341 RepID=UPI00082401ED|nr:urea ABC transporter permease subunit UrtB [Gallibacterium salpingitidis]